MLPASLSTSLTHGLNSPAVHTPETSPAAIMCVRGDAASAAEAAAAAGAEGAAVDVASEDEGADRTANAAAPGDTEEGVEERMME